MTTNRHHPHPRRLALRLGLMAVAVLLGLVVAACGGNTTEPTATPDTAGAGEIAADPTVAVSDHTFGPTELTVAAGTAVSWNWDGSAQHNVVGDGFESPTQAKGTFEHTFGTPGTYTYVCTLHQGMDGTITVVER